MKTLNDIIKSKRGHIEFKKILETCLELYNKGEEISEIEAQIEKIFGVYHASEFKTTASPLNILGDVGVDVDMESLNQIYTALKLPVSIRGAILPDSHVGYSLPIGGVISLVNAISPHFIGFDIACRISLSILDIEVEDYFNSRDEFYDAVKTETSFGIGASFKKKRKHKVMEDDLWNEIPALKKLKTLAHSQLGSSGGGNHFVDVVLIEFNSSFEGYDVSKIHVGILSHSGSRGVGHKMATYYSHMAKEWTHANVLNVPTGYEYLPINHDLGSEYWNVMHLMGDYAKANHELIHQHITKKLGVKILHYIDNHHNFCWLENGEYVHRKGATPAGMGKLGIVGGTMATPSYLTVGLGNEEFINSSSHGAGRLFSRTKAKQNFNKDLHEEITKSRNILTNGIASDESFQGYKDISRVMELQEGVNLKVLASLQPSIVFMGGKSDDGD